MSNTITFFLVMTSIVVLIGCSLDDQPHSAAGVNTGTIEYMKSTFKDDRSNCILIMVDGLRADVLDKQINHGSLVPNISRLAGESLHFTHARSASSLLVQSVSTVISGRLPTLGGTIGLYEAEPHDGQPNLARAFDSAGYHTGIISNQAIVGSYQFTRHFDEIQLATLEQPRSATDLVGQAQQFIEDASSEQFFLYLHFRLPLPPVPDEESYYRAIADVDAALGDLFARLDSLDNESFTLIALTAPNGFELSEHGGIGNGWTLNEEVLRVPLILHAPVRFMSAVVDEPISLQQLAPTLGTLFNLGQSFPDAQSLFKSNGSNLVLTLPTAPLVSELIIPERVIMRSVTDGTWKYTVATRYTTPENRIATARAHVATAQSYRDGSDQPPPLWGSDAYEAIFDLSSDPHEQHNRIDDHSVSVNQLQDALRAYRNHCAQHAIAPRMSTLTVEELTPENLEGLESLGYL
ncbi:MAG: sulfatase-like hydrolase/transferase [Candidatus Hydrogenedentota bacterium]